MPSKIRLEKISDRLHRDLSELLLFKLQDPRLEGVFINDVNVDRELAFADVFVSAVEGSARSSEILEGLSAAAGFMRHELAGKYELRTFPRFRFHWDPTPENADHIERLLQQIREEADRKGANNP